MSTITVNLPALSVEQALAVFPELDAKATVNLSTSEATLQMKQAASDWASIIQVQADSLDEVETAADDVLYKIASAWPSYDTNSGANEVTFKAASFNGSGHSTKSSNATDATKLKDAMKYNTSEDFVGTKDAFDIFSNEELLYADYDTQADALEGKVTTTWATLKDADTESLGAGVLSNATASEHNPARTIVQAILNSTSHPSKATLADNLAARGSNTDYANCPLVAGDKLNFNITYKTPTRVGGQDVPATGLSSNAPGPRDHIFQVEVELV
jgi:hypothetical protein